MCVCVCVCGVGGVAHILDVCNLERKEKEEKKHARTALDDDTDISEGKEAGLSLCATRLV